MNGLIELPAHLGRPDRVRIGPNEVHAAIFHNPGCGHGAKRFEYEDLGISPNLETNTGKDWRADALGGAAGFGITSTIATASSATSLTATGTPFVASAYIGQIVIAEETTNAPVWGTIVANTTSVLTIDGWRYGDQTTGSTPGATANYLILPANAPASYMALTENASAANAADTALTGELTTGGCARARATYAHTDATTTYTMTKAFSVTATFPAIHKAALLTSSTLAGAGFMWLETVLNADASVVNGDTLTVTWTVTET